MMRGAYKTTEEWNEKTLQAILRFAHMLERYNPDAHVEVWLEAGKLYYKWIKKEPAK